MSKEQRLKQKKVGTPEQSSQGMADVTDIPVTPSLLPRVAKLTALGRILSESKITSVESARAFLRGQGVLGSDKVVDIPVICAALNALAGSPFKSVFTLTDGIKSVCLILKDITTSPLVAEDVLGKNGLVIKELAEQKATLAWLETTIIKLVSNS